MTVTATSRRAAYTGNGATKTFAVPFQFFEIAVYVNGVLKTVGVDYTIAQSSTGSTGSITFGVAPVNLATVSIVGATNQAQTLDLLDNDSAPAETYERGLDRLTMLVQEAIMVFTQSLRASPFAAALPEIDFKGNPLSFLNTDSNGVPRLSLIDGPTSPFTPLLSLASNSANAAAASAANADVYKQAAQVASDSAEVSRAAAQGYANTFANTYLGAKSSDPALDNSGNPLVAGALYLSTTENKLKGWTGSAWA